MKKTIIISSIALLLVVGIASAMTLNGTPTEIKELVGQVEIVEPETMFGGQSIISAYPVDLIGTRVGTTTTSVDFNTTRTGGQSASTLYPIKVGHLVNGAIYTVEATLASTTGNNLTMTFLASNDNDCDTASTTTTMADTIIISDINWFDISDHLTNTVHDTAWTNASSTLVWTDPMAETGREATLENLNYECLGLRISGSSTSAWVQIITNQD